MAVIWSLEHFWISTLRKVDFERFVHTDLFCVTLFELTYRKIFVAPRIGFLGTIPRLRRTKVICSIFARGKYANFLYILVVLALFYLNQNYELIGPRSGDANLNSRKFYDIGIETRLDARVFDDTVEGWRTVSREWYDTNVTKRWTFEQKRQCRLWAEMANEFCKKIERSAGPHKNIRPWPF